MLNLLQRAEHTFPEKSTAGVQFITLYFDKNIRHWNRATRQVFMMVNGRHSIAGIAQMLHMPIEVVGRICVELAVNGFVTIKERAKNAGNASDAITKGAL